MLKQILNKLPRKSAKSDSHDSNTEEFGDGNCSENGGCQSIRSGASKRTSSAVFPSGVVVGIEPLQEFKDVPSSERMNLFISKLNLCGTVFDFNDIGKNSVEKDMKRQILIELVNFISSVSYKFPESVITALCRMCAMNLFRVFPPNYRSNSSSCENEEDDPVFDPAWSHLQIVYEILLKFITSSSMEAKIAKKSVNHVFVMRILDLFHSEDPRERECLKTLLHRIYGKFMVHRPFIRKIIGNIFYRYVFELERHNGISELLEIFGSIISGFALPLKEEHKLFLWRALIPLHKPKYLGFYFQQLSFCISQFIEKDPKLAGMVIKGLLKYWPITNSQKEVMFLGELEEILEGINMIEFQKVMVPLFWRIGCCIQSFHFQVAERALFFWNNDQIVNLIAHNRHVILPIVFPALERNGGTHWNHAVLNLTLNVRKMFLEMDEALLFACDTRFHQEEAALCSVAERRKLAWQHLEHQADLLKPGVTGNTAVLVSASDLRTAADSLSPFKRR